MTCEFENRLGIEDLSFNHLKAIAAPLGRRNERWPRRLEGTSLAVAITDLALHQVAIVI